ncbi:AMP-dependent synthetase/ligase [Bailinhaonella thermotolerans]|uniref:Acyl-CoA synthetase n=1 Tax=Bailinhaonella thermotolerans TaxID=1070861 RepID=A0A3A4BBY0_9ACTN|nr:AMP-dependent synthetase/ligase [Bailinhaonella thermotolerans]RJL36033.1 long-chain fatty acid--CoA ligase [Bailinhaonella thermotolerans]
MADSPILAERAAILDEIAGRTICAQFADITAAHPDAPAYSNPAGDGWDTLTYGEARRRVLEAASAFLALGIEPGDAVTLMMVNRTEHVLADLGALHAGAVPITVYATLAPEQVSYIAADCRARAVVLGGAADLARWESALAELPHIEHVIVLDPAACPDGERYLTWDRLMELGRERYDEAAVRARYEAIRPEDTLTVLYTSGTTGVCKGVPLTHANVCFEVAVVDRVGELGELNPQISYLTYAHIAERVLSMYLPLFKASHVHFCPDPLQLAGVLRQVRPATFFGVPRVWEKLMAGLLAVLATQPEEQQARVREAMAAGVAYLEAGQRGATPPEEIREAYEKADASLLSTIRGLIGFDRAHWVGSGAAPLSLDVQRFFAGLGINILEVYGMTETTGAFTANGPGDYSFGSVGRAVPGVEVRLAEDGEILMRGPIAASGYRNLPEATAELIDADGWLRTGDVGEVDEDGYYRVVDRKKELFITAGGENVAPSLIENHLKRHPLIAQALAYGDRRPYPVALITLDPEVAPRWAEARGIPFTSLADFAERPEVVAEVATAVEQANARLARVQQIKHWRVLPVEWTTETDELTPKFSLKRRVIHAKYADVIDTLYDAT